MTGNEKQIKDRDEVKKKIRERYKGIDKSELEFIPARQKERLFEDTSLKRVCAYCRVSTDDAKQTSSYELQKNHYEEMILEHPGWELVGIYADEGISGTSMKHRDAFNRMMADCKAGKIDLIITKSVSRFARNIVDCIANVRELAALPKPVGVFFETEHIDTLDNVSEMMLAVLSAAAQEESHTKSEIMNISIEQRFSRGIFLTPALLGYDLDEEGDLVINPEEAQTVRLIYYLFLTGHTTGEIAQILTELKRRTKRGNTTWSAGSISQVIQNERHCGDVLSRKTYTPNYLDHKSKKNRQDRNQYRKTDHHEGIVSHEIFDAAQELLTSYRYRKDGSSLPVLQVIEHGVLKGFVPVYRNWSGFSADDYILASREGMGTVDDSEENIVETVEAGQEKIYLDGFEVVRSQFFSTRTNPALNISGDKITFNTACLKKFRDVEYVELLFNAVDKCLAIRPCDGSADNAIKWASLRDGRWYVLPKSSRGFSKALYEVMDWKADNRYRLRGYYAESEEAQVMMFDLSEPEIQVPVSAEKTDSEKPENESRSLTEIRNQSVWVRSEMDADSDEIVVNLQERQYEPMDAGDEPADGVACKLDILYGDEGSSNSQNPDNKILYEWEYPMHWKEHFGIPDGEKTAIFMRLEKYRDNWDILCPTVTVEGHQPITADVLKELAEDAGKMIIEMRNGVA